MAHLSWMVTSNTLLPEPLWSGHSGDRVRVSKFQISWLPTGEVDCCWQEIRRTGPAAGLLSVFDLLCVLLRAVLASCCITEMNRRGLPPPVAVRDYRPWLQCSETGSLVSVQETVYTWTSAFRRQTTQTHAGNCDVKGRCWRQATQDKRLQRQLPLSIPECPVGRRSPGSGNHMLRVVHSV